MQFFQSNCIQLNLIESTCIQLNPKKSIRYFFFLIRIRIEKKFQSILVCRVRSGGAKFFLPIARQFSKSRPNKPPHPSWHIRWRRGAKKPFRKDTKGAKDERASQDDSR